MAEYFDPWKTLPVACERIRPPMRIAPAEQASMVCRFESGPLTFDTAPMMVEPLNVMNGRDYQGVVFVGPQRSSKTAALVWGALSWIITTAPAHSLLIAPTEQLARRMSKQELDSILAASPELRSRMSDRLRDDNVLDKWFKSGMSVYLGYSAASQLTQRTVKFVLITEYDRPENRDDVDGLGSLWDLAFKRIETYMSLGKCVAESAPGVEVLDANWVTPADEPHRAPPALGILSLYNTGTRARWYFRCPLEQCGGFFEAAPGYDLFRLGTFEQQLELIDENQVEDLVVEYARVPCPCCGGLLNQGHKRALNAHGRWLHEGQSFEGGRVVGDRRRSNIWSGWMGGVAASYQTWEGMLRSYFQALEIFRDTGSETSLKQRTQSDAAAPYVPRAMVSSRSVVGLSSRLEDTPKHQLDPAVRFAVAAIDVQKSKFVVQVHAFGVGLEEWIVDRYHITASMRPEGRRFAAVDPPTYLEDWALLEAVAKRTYGILGTDLALPVLTVFCDAGGEARKGEPGVYNKALAFWRGLRDAGRGMHNRIQLCRGRGGRAGLQGVNADRVKLTKPDARKRKDRKSSAAGDVPVWVINTNLLKDAVATDLARKTPGPGYVHIPRWIVDEHPSFLEELVAEVRTPTGWTNPKRKRNEATDLAVYCRAAVIAIGGDRINWDKPPAWAVEPANRADQLAAGTIRRKSNRRSVRSGGPQI